MLLKDGGQKNKKILFDSDSENEEENIISQKVKKLTESSKKNVVGVVKLFYIININDNNAKHNLGGIVK